MQIAHTITVLGNKKLENGLDIKNLGWRQESKKFGKRLIDLERSSVAMNHDPQNQTIDQLTELQVRRYILTDVVALNQGDQFGFRQLVKFAARSAHRDRSLLLSLFLPHYAPC